MLLFRENDLYSYDQKFILLIIWNLISACKNQERNLFINWKLLLKTGWSFFLE
jgi:hypothetical protein